MFDPDPDPRDYDVSSGIQKEVEAGINRDELSENPSLFHNEGIHDRFPQHPQQRQWHQQHSQQQQQPPPHPQYYAQQQSQQQQERIPSPGTIDKILSREIMQLSLQDRNNIQEEVHGVKCLAPLETPQLITSSLRRLEEELDRYPPSKNKLSFLVAQHMGNDSYVNTVEFKLQFLRKCLFDSKEAAVCLCEFLYRIHSLFGKITLERHPNLHTDFTRAELRQFRKGHYQLLPFRDRSARRILIIFPDKEVEQMEPQLRAKFICYLCIVAIRDDVETQRNGIVVLVWFPRTYTPAIKIGQLKQSALENWRSWGCVRVSAIHVCSPDTPLFRIARYITVLRANEDRVRLKLHVGEPIELRYILHGYGIPTENIPMTWSGTIKVIYLKNWMKLRKAMEDGSSNMTGVVECPNSKDVIFRQGTSLCCHPGNARFRSLVESAVIRLRKSSNNRKDNAKNNNTNIPGQQDMGNPDNTEGNNDDEASSSKRTSTLIFEIMDEIIIKDKGHVLVWTYKNADAGAKYGCWCTITNEDQIYSKIEYIVRDHIRGVGSNSSRSSSSSGQPDGTAQAATTLKAEKQKSNLQTTESSTSIFRSGFVDSSSTTRTLSNMQPLSSQLPNKRAKTKMATSNSSDLASNDDDSVCKFLCNS